MKSVLINEAQYKSLLLNEASVSDVRKKHMDIPEDIFYALCKSDPKYNKNEHGEFAGKFTHWLCQQYENGDIDKSDISGIKENLLLFIQNKNRMDFPPLNNITYSELVDFVSPLKDGGDDDMNPILKSIDNKDVRENTEIWYDDDEWLVVIPHSYEASRYWGGDTRWCTASSNPYYYNYYKNEYGGEYYININKKTNEKYQFHFESSQFMDEDDNSITPSEIGLTSELMEKYEEEKNVDLDNLGVDAERYREAVDEDSVYVWTDYHGYGGGLVLSQDRYPNENDMRLPLSQGECNYYLYDTDYDEQVDSEEYYKENSVYKSIDGKYLIMSTYDGGYKIYFQSNNTSSHSNYDYVKFENINEVTEDVFLIDDCYSDATHLYANGRFYDFNDMRANELESAIISQVDDETFLIQTKGEDMDGFCLYTTMSEDAIILNEYPSDGEYFEVGKDGYIHTKFMNEDGSVYEGAYTLDGKDINSEGWHVVKMLSGGYYIRKYEPKDSEDEKYALFKGREQVSEFYDRINIVNYSRIGFIKGEALKNVMFTDDMGKFIIPEGNSSYSISTYGKLSNGKYVCEVYQDGNFNEKNLMYDDGDLLFKNPQHLPFKISAIMSSMNSTSYMMAAFNDDTSEIIDCVNRKIVMRCQGTSFKSLYGKGMCLVKSIDGFVCGITKEGGLMKSECVSIELIDDNNVFIGKLQNGKTAVLNYQLQTLLTCNDVDSATYYYGNGLLAVLNDNNKWEIWKFDMETKDNITKVVDMEFDSYKPYNNYIFVSSNGQQYKLYYGNDGQENSLVPINQQNESKYNKKEQIKEEFFKLYNRLENIF